MSIRPNAASGPAFVDQMFTSSMGRTALFSCHISRTNAASGHGLDSCPVARQSLDKMATTWAHCGGWSSLAEDIKRWD